MSYHFFHDCVPAAVFAGILPTALKQKKIRPLFRGVLAILPDVAVLAPLSGRQAENRNSGGEIGMRQTFMRGLSVAEQGLRFTWELF